MKRHPLTTLVAVLLLAPLAALGAPDSPATKDKPPDKQTSQMLRDPGFEALPSGLLGSTGANAAWEVQRTGREVIRDRLVVACVEDEAEAKSGRKCLSLSIPKDTVGFEFATIGQRVQLAAGTEYEAAVWVRWPAGPDTAPAGASSISGHRSAIVSFWARHREGKGDFAGRDEWLFDNRWHRLSFRFWATAPQQRTLLYLSLLPNQKPADTTVLVDDFELSQLVTPAETESRQQNLTLDADFTQQSLGPISLPWHFTNRGGQGITGKVAEVGGTRFVTLAMGTGTSNFESAQLWQHLALCHGARYEVSCRMRWDNFTPGVRPPIVNYGIYHEETRTWYGPVDQVLEKTGEWRTYAFTHIPPYSGKWKLYVQLNGWGNFGHAVTVSLDHFRCIPVK